MFLDSLGTQQSSYATLLKLVMVLKNFFLYLLILLGKVDLCMYIVIVVFNDVKACILKLLCKQEKSEYPSQVRFL